MDERIESKGDPSVRRAPEVAYLQRPETIETEGKREYLLFRALAEMRFKLWLTYVFLSF